MIWLTHISIKTTPIKKTMKTQTGITSKRSATFSGGPNLALGWVSVVSRIIQMGGDGIQINQGQPAKTFYPPCLLDHTASTCEACVDASYTVNSAQVLLTQRFRFINCHRLNHVISTTDTTLH